MKRKIRNCMIIVSCILIYLGFIILPYIKQPKISSGTKKALDLKAFCLEDNGGERAKVISDNGEALEERVRLISQAKEEIILSTFRFESDEAGKIMLSALADAAHRGVKISVISDGFSYLTTMWGNPYFLALSSMENVEFRIYNPIRFWKPWTFMGRLHDKYLIADQRTYILGGRNTFGYFLGDQPGYKNYDWDMLVYKEDIEKKGSMEQLIDYFHQIWNYKESKIIGKSRLWRYNPSVKKAREELLSSYECLKKEHRDWMQEKDYLEDTLPVNHAQLIANPIHVNSKEPLVFYLTTELMKEAKEEVVLHTPYMICDNWMIEQLGKICDSVEHVEILTNSVANNGNPFGAMDYQLHKKDLINTGVHIQEYDGGVSYHGKCFTVDDRISGLGSFNWDMRSAYLDTELMLVIDSPEITASLKKNMEKYEADALSVVDETSYDLKEGQKPQAISKKKQSTIRQIQTIGRWARFLF